MVIQPLTKKDGTTYTNVELNNICYEKLLALKNGVGAKTKKEKERMEDDFYRICGGSKNAEEIMAFMKQIYDIEDETEAQKTFERGLIPVEGIR